MTTNTAQTTTPRRTRPRLRLVAEFSGTRTAAEARAALDAFRETVQPSTEYGLLLYQDESITALRALLDEMTTRKRTVYDTTDSGTTYAEALLALADQVAAE